MSLKKLLVGRVSSRSKNRIGAHGVMVIIAGNGHGDTSSNLGRD